MINPETNDRWAEKSGEMITVDNVAFNRVTFIRDGYEFPCIFPLERFVKEFTFVSRGRDMKNAPNLKHLPKEKYTEAVILRELMHTLMQKGGRRGWVKNCRRHNSSYLSWAKAVGGTG